MKLFMLTSHNILHFVIQREATLTSQVKISFYISSVIMLKNRDGYSVPFLYRFICPGNRLSFN